MSKSFLDRLKEQHDALRADIEAAQNRSVAEDRDLTDEELREVSEKVEAGKVLAQRITDAHEDATRAAAVAALAPVPSPAETRSASGTSATDRDPGYYRSVEEGGHNSFFSDMYRSKYNDDQSAAGRLRDHTRAQLATTGTGTGNTAGNTGVIPPKWMTDLFLPLSRQNRVLSQQVTPLNLGNDPRPIVLPLQVADASGTALGTQVEGQAVTGDAQYQTSTETLTPAAIAGKQIVTRQLVDSSTPAVDALIVQDLLSRYDSQVEALVAAAFVSAATATATFATDHTGTGAANWAYVAANVNNPLASLADAQTAVWTGVFNPATFVAMNPARYGAWRKLSDGQGRPLLTPYSPQNGVGVQGGERVNGLVGEIDGLPVYVSTGLGTSIGPDDTLVGIVKDAILAESDLMQFRFEEVQGPQNIVLGIWRYAGVLVRRAGGGVKRVRVTAA